MTAATGWTVTWKGRGWWQTFADYLDYLEVLNRGIEVMDNTAVTLCMDNDVPILVFNLLIPGNIERVILGEEIGTLVGAAR